METRGTIGFERAETGPSSPAGSARREVFAEVEEQLRRDPSIHDCFVRHHPSKSIVCYLVPAGPVSIDRLQERLGRVPDEARPTVYVSVARIPLSADGEIDRPALDRVPVVDTDAVQGWTQAVSALPEVREAAAVAIEAHEISPPLHLSDLLPVANKPAESKGESKPMPGSTPAPESTRPALVKGDPLEIPANTPTTLGELIARAARESPHRGMVYVLSNGTETRQTYPELLDEAQRIATGLRFQGFAHGANIILRARENRDFFPGLWGCILAGLVPVPVPPIKTGDRDEAKKFTQIWELLGRPPILATSKEVMHSDEREPKLVTIAELRNNPLPFEPARNTQPGDVALILLTSGSTGVSKAVMQTHRNLLCFCAANTQANRFSPEDTSLNWMPVEHIGAIADFHLRSMYLGADQLHAQTDGILANPLRWLELVDRHRIRVTWAPNFAYGLINDRATQLGSKALDLSTLRFVINAGEAVIARTAQRFLDLLRPKGLSSTAMRPTWGMSETCSGALYGAFPPSGFSEQDATVEVGRPLPGLAFRVADAADCVLPEGSVGELQVRGPTVTVGYFANPAATRAAFTEDGWFRTGDLAVVRNGRVSITGRAKDIIIINGVHFQPGELESPIGGLYGIASGTTVVCTVRTEGSETEKLAVFFQSRLKSENELRDLLTEIRSLVAAEFGVAPEFLLPCDPAAIPRTSIGKVQRTELRRRFEAGAFEPIRRQMDVLTANTNTLPDWFYRVQWTQRKPRPGNREMLPVLVFLDEGGLGRAVLSILEHSGRPAMTVEPAQGFAQIGPGRFTVDPQNPGDFELLVATFQQHHGPLREVLHLWTCDHDRAGTMLDSLKHAGSFGLAALLALGKTIQGKNPKGTTCRWCVVSAGAQAGAISPASLGAALIPPFLKSLAAENPFLRCRHVDLPPTWHSESIARSAACISDELGLDDETEVAYRDGIRLCPRLQKIDFPSLARSQLPFRKNGLYLLTGGLGGIGGSLARLLLEQYEARLVVIGRTELPDGTEESFPDSPATARLQALRALQRLPGSILYRTADVCDRDAVRETVAAACLHFGTDLAGVIHLAANAAKSEFLGQTHAGLSAAMREKTTGTCVLGDLLQDKPDALFVGFSSITSFFGGAREGTYAMGNRFLEGFVEARRAAGSANSYCLAWSRWDGIGMAKADVDESVLLSRGYHSLSLNQGMNSLRVALSHGLSHVLIGLDGTNRHIRRHRIDDTEGPRLRSIVTYFTGHADKSALAALQIRDRLRSPSQSEFVQLSAMPRLETGAVDLAALVALSERRRAGSAGPAKRTPQTDLERRLVAIWAELLCLDRSCIGLDDNFFGLGGHSLTAAELMAHIETACGIDLQPGILFQFPTIAGLCTAIAAVKGAASRGS